MADTKTVKHVVTNVSGGPKVVNSVPGVLLQDGETTPEPVEMTEAEYAVAKKTEWFRFGASKPADAKD